MLNQLRSATGNDFSSCHLALHTILTVLEIPHAHISLSPCANLASECEPDNFGAKSAIALPPVELSRIVMNSTAKSGVTNFTCDDNALGKYPSARWLWNEEEQLERRCVPFNAAALANVAATAAGSKSCVSVTKLLEGNFNKVFLLVMDDGKRGYCQNSESQCWSSAFDDCQRSRNDGLYT